MTYSFANDANLVALATTRQTPGWSHVAVLVERPSGTGMGLLLGGKLYQGRHGRAGEIGRSRWPTPSGAQPLEHLPSTERLDATAFMLAGLVHTLDLQHVVLGLPQGRAFALQEKLSGLLDLSITIQLLPDVDDAVLRGAALLAREQAQEHLLERVEDLEETTPMWHDTYLKVVLQPDYDYASEHLLPHLFDALSAHALMLEGCGVAHAGEAARLLRELRREPFPAYDPSVEDVFFTLDRDAGGPQRGRGGGAANGAVSQRPGHDHLPPERPAAPDAGHGTGAAAAAHAARPRRA